MPASRSSSHLCRHSARSGLHKCELDLDLHTVARAWLDRMTSLQHSNPSARLRAALAIGTDPDPSYIGELLERCAVEPDFNVRETLTWALMRHPESLTVPRLVEQVQSGNNQARSQALHTLSKIKGPNSWPVITPDLLSDPDDEVARSAWRAAVVLVPQAQRLPLATMLSTQLGRGSREMQLSLSRALLALGDVIEPVLRGPHRNVRARAHAIATERLLRDPDAGFELDIEMAKRVSALGQDS